MTVASQKPNNPAIIAGIVLIILLLFSLSFSGSPSVLQFFGLRQINAASYFISRLLYWMCLIIIWLYSIKIEKQNLLIWEEKKYTISTYLLSAIAIFAAMFIGMLIIQIVLSLLGHKEHSARLSELVSIFRNNKFLLVFTALTAGIEEELIFRGYLLPRFEIIFKNPYPAIFISSLIFGLMHYKYGTLFNMAGPFFIGLIFAWHYWKYRNIKILIVSHFLWDIFGLLVLIKNK